MLHRCSNSVKNVQDNHSFLKCCLSEGVVSWGDARYNKQQILICRNVPIERFPETNLLFLQCTCVMAPVSCVIVHQCCSVSYVQVLWFVRCLESALHVDYPSLLHAPLLDCLFAQMKVITDSRKLNKKL